MYKKIFDLINDELNSILAKEKFYELKKLEIREYKVKFVFLDSALLAVKVFNYELDLFGPEPRLKHKKDYLKPYKDKYFR
jgi:hypothetical protein